MKKQQTEFHKNGTIKATGKLLDGKREGYWKWYREDGSKQKVGFFKQGKLAKDWMKYDKKGKLIKGDAV